MQNLLLSFMVLAEEIRISQLTKNFSLLYENVYSLQFSYERVSGLCEEAHQSFSQTHNLGFYQFQYYYYYYYYYFL